ncbi:MAG: hypothetical protein IPK62_03025 [Bacteroidetes bacterium]|jgi:hypothetical protein|nr:hypothetical protein [Bacteroidota bacterium]MBK8144036.1 hypothetical protein [Bacteroidota bacterium]
MKILNWKKDKKTPASDPYLYNRLNADMNYCGLKPEIQKGFLFYMGAAISIGINESPVDLRQQLATADLQKETYLKIVNAYSQSTGNFSDYGDLDDGFFSKMIYTINSILFQLSGIDPNEIDKQLRTVEIGKLHLSTILKMDVHKDLQEKYANKSYNLNICHNLLEDIFFIMGDYLHKTGYDLGRSYEAGYAHFYMQTTMDVNGTRFLLSTIYNSLTPLYKAFFSYPILNFACQDALKANHIFSNTLQMFYAGINPEIFQPIHRFHQFVFYVPDSHNFRPQWDFETRNDSDKQAIIFLNALSIRNTDIMSLKSQFLAYDDLMCPELKNCVIDRDEFYYTMKKGIIGKYNIRPAENEPEVWNNLGDLIQYFCILFYETCLHALVLDEVIINE